MLDIDKPLFGKEEKDILRRCINDASLFEGKYVLRFEKEFADYCRIKYACATMNGTSALHLALVALKIKPDDEVLVPTLTFIASVSPVSFCGAKPVFVDCDPYTWCIDSEDLKRKITNKSKAVIPVHLYGNACDMDEICNIAKKYDLSIIEDCAEAQGTLYNGRQVGVFSSIAFFSFYKNKHITTGEGGMCLTNDKYLLTRLKLLRSHGKNKVEDLSVAEFAQKQFISSELGFNYRMTDLQAAIGLVQLKKINKAIAKRIKYAEIYAKALKDLDVILPSYNEHVVRHTFWGFPLLLKDAQTKTRIMLEFRKYGIRLRPFFNPCHLQPFYKHFKSRCPVAEEISSRGIVLPNIHSLKEDDIYSVAKLLRKCL
jgi:perosamine synthetase